MTKTTPFTLLFAAATCLVLTACSRGPSEEDFQRSFISDLQRQANGVIQSAHARYGDNEQAMQQAQQQATLIRSIQLIQVKKVACEEQPDHSYLCRFQVLANANGRAVQDASITRFLKTDGGWVGAQ